MPEVRQMLRDSNFVNTKQEIIAQNMVEERKKLKKGVKHRTLRMNRRGQKPKKMRHRMKCEDSNEESSEEEETIPDSQDTDFGEDLMAGDEAGPPGMDEDAIAASELRSKRVKVHQKMI